MKQLCCLLLLFLLFGFSNDKDRLAVKNNLYTFKDTVHIDDLVEKINNQTIGRKCDKTVVKKFRCKTCVDSGTVQVGYRGKEVIFLNVMDYPEAQRITNITSMFFNGALAWNFNVEVLWEFDRPESDSTRTPSTTTEIRTTDYYYKGKKIRTDLERESLVASSEKSKYSRTKAYYFDQTGEAPDMMRINQWVAFAASEKSYDEFFAINPKR